VGKFIQAPIFVQYLINFKGVSCRLERELLIAQARELLSRLIIQNAIFAKRFESSMTAVVGRRRNQLFP
jgi:hypothetical protein